MDLQEYKKAIMLIQEPAELLTVTEMKDRVKLFGHALQFKAWRMETAAARLNRLEAGHVATLDVTPEELDELWPWPDDPEVELRDNGFVTVQRLGDGVAWLPGVALAVTILGAAAFLFG